MTTFINNRLPQQSSYYRQATTYAQPAQPPPPPPKPIVTDDYERWYPESTPGNRMSLSVRSGIHSEINWALNRLCRLSMNDTFYFSTIPGLLDSLFEWPEWYATEGYKRFSDSDILFSLPPDLLRQHRFALESLFIIRNAAFNDANARELQLHSHTLPLIMNSLYNLDHDRDENTEHLQLVIELFNTLFTSYYIYPPSIPRLNPFPPLMTIAASSKNRTTIVSALTALTALFLNPGNALHLKSGSPALTAAIQYLPLYDDKILLDACLNYMYAHISHPAMARAFLLHPDMPRVLKALAGLLVHEQQGLEKSYTLDITGSIHTVPSYYSSQPAREHELSQEELDTLVGKPEPQRCYDWMKTMFAARAEGEVTQVDFWNMYKDAFSPFAEQYELLAASDVIKNVNNVFPQAQAMVIQGSTPRFVVRGVDRRKDVAPVEKYKCLWDRTQCAAPACTSLGELYDHVLEHLSAADSPEFPCLWSSCPQPPLSKHALSSHVLTHLSSIQTTTKHPSQSDTITLPSASYPYPNETPTTRPAPPPRSTTITYELPVIDPPSTSLTALLVIRILFRTSFASADAAPRVDADHFGFPGVVEDTDDPEGADLADGGAEGDEREGERRGRKAFVGIENLLEGVRIRDDALMSWVTEMVDAGFTESNT